MFWISSYQCYYHYSHHPTEYFLLNLVFYLSSRWWYPNNGISAKLLLKPLLNALLSIVQPNWTQVILVLISDGRWIFMWKISLSKAKMFKDTNVLLNIKMGERSAGIHEGEKLKKIVKVLSSEHNFLGIKTMH